VALALLGAAAWWGRDARQWLLPTTAAPAPLTVTVVRKTLPVVITAGGELESSAAVEGVCELEGLDHKIVEMLPEGSHVTKGQVVIRLDPAQTKDKLATQKLKMMQAEANAKVAAETLKIQQNLTASQVAQAELAVQLTKLDKKKYLEGEYQADLSALQGKISLAKAALQDAQDMVGFFRDLVKKGFRTPEQLRAKEQAAQEAQYTLDSHQERLKVLENFIRERQEVELTAKAIQAQRELERAQSSAAAAIAKAQTDLQVTQAAADLENEQLRRIQRQLEFCEVRAQAEGTLVYDKDKSKRIELGAVAHFKQKLFSVPDMSRMHVRAWVHESEVKKVQRNMPAEIRVDAFPNLVMSGVVREVSNFYDSTRHWLSGGVKEYAALVQIETVGDAGLKPGMTSQVTIHLGELSDCLVLPLAAVTEQAGQYYAFVVQEQSVTPRPVSLGGHTDNYVAILDGLHEGEQVALDAQQRAAEWPWEQPTSATVAQRAAPSTAPAAGAEHD
jgi:RND family efflux transporter MFP subunit